MTVLEELERKIGEAEQEIRRTLDKLNGMADLEDALGGANRSISGAADGLVKLSHSLAEAVENFKLALVSFRDASKSIRDTDPARLLDAVARTESRLESVQKLVTSAVPHIERIERIEPGLGEVVRLVGEVVTRETSASARRVREAAEADFTRMFEAVEIQGRRLNGMRSISILALIVGLAVLGINIYLVAVIFRA